MFVFLVVIHCPPPADGTFNTYYPVKTEYPWNDTVDYTCNFGYNHSTGDLHRECQHDKTWSGVTPVCISMLFSVTFWCIIYFEGLQVILSIWYHILSLIIMFVLANSANQNDMSNFAATHME